MGRIEGAGHVESSGGEGFETLDPPTTDNGFRDRYELAQRCEVVIDASFDRAPGQLRQDGGGTR